MNKKVQDVMTTDVVTVREEASFKEIVAAVQRTGVHAVPVVDADGRVLGVVSVTDLLLKQTEPEAADVPRALAGPRLRVELRKAAATTAADLMTSPAIAIAPTATLEQAAGTLRRHRVGRLPVVSDGTLVGIVSRRDIVGVYVRPDAEIGDDIMNDLISIELAMDPGRFAATVTDGQVVLQGKVERRSQIPMLLHAVRRVEGVVSVEAHIGYDTDDSADTWMTSTPLR